MSSKQTKTVVTLYIDATGLMPQTVDSYCQKQKEALCTDEFYDFFGGKNKVICFAIPCKNMNSQITVQTIEVDY